MKIQNALVSNRFDQSQRYFAHVTTVTLSWRVQNIVVIGRVYFTLECFEFSSNFEFDRNMLSGTGAWWKDHALLLNSSPSAAYIHRWTGSTLVHVMACRLFGAKPLPEAMLPDSQLNSLEQISVKLKPEFYHFHSRKFIWKCRLPKWPPFCPGGDELKEGRPREPANPMNLCFSVMEIYLTMVQSIQKIAEHYPVCWTLVD